MAEIKYEIVERIAVLGERPRGWERQLNLISWNEGEPKYDKDAGKQAINLNAHYAYSSSTLTLADVREIGLITTSFTDDTTHEKVKVRFAVVASALPPTP